MLNWCNGGCPKDRFARSRATASRAELPVPGLELFFTHTDRPFTSWCGCCARVERAADVMASIVAEDAKLGPTVRALRQRQEVPLLPW